MPFGDRLLLSDQLVEPCVDHSAASPLIDIDALGRYWAVCPKLRRALFQETRPGYLGLAVDKAAIKSTIYGHPEFAVFIAGEVRKWRGSLVGVDVPRVLRLAQESRDAVMRRSGFQMNLVG